MGILDRILGTDQQPPRPRAQGSAGAAAPPNGSASPDEQAVERYRYMLKTAPPETIEAAHAEAFERLTPEQRKLALSTLARSAPENERAAAEAVSPDDPRAMGRLATRAEMRQPGFLERNFGGGGGMGMGGSLMTSFAAGFVGSMVAQSFFSSMGGGGENNNAADDNAAASNDVDGDQGEDGDAADVGDADGDMGGDDFGGGGDFDV